MKNKESKLYKRVIGFLAAVAVIITSVVCDRSTLKVQAVTVPYYPGGVATLTESGGYIDIATDAASCTCIIKQSASGAYIMYEYPANTVATMDLNNNILRVPTGVTIYVDGGQYGCTANIQVNGGTVYYTGASKNYPNKGTIDVQSGSVMFDNTYFDCHETSGAVKSSASGSITVSSGSQLYAFNNEPIYGNLVNNGSILFFNQFVGVSTSHVENYGRIEGSNIDIGYSNSFASFIDNENATYRAFYNHFSKGNFNLNGTVEVDDGFDDLIIRSKGGRMAVKYEGVTVVKTEACNERAKTCVPKASYSVSTAFSKQYVGMTENDLLSKISLSPATADLTVKYASSEDGYTEKFTEFPTAVGSYKAYISVSATDYRPTTDSEESFTISYLQKSEIKSEMPSCTVSGTKVDGIYSCPIYKDKLTITTSEGYLISPSLSDEFTDSFTVTTNNYHDGVQGFYKVNDASIIGYYENSLKGAITSGMFLSSASIIIDSKAPEIVDSLDQDNAAVTIEEGSTTVKARALKITIEDRSGDYNMLDMVTVNGSEDGVTTDSSGKKTVTLKMIMPGKKTYEIVAKDYVGHTSKWTINMEYLPTATPATPFTISGTEGKNGYYTSDVTLIPAEGYTISADVNGTFTDTLVYKPEIERVYLMNSEGLFTSPIEVDSYLVDKTSPEFSTASDENGNKYDIADGMEIHAKSVSFDITDKNLTDVIVNGKAVEINDGKATVELIPSKGKIEDFDVYAEDVAGNGKYAKVTVEYLKDVATATVSVGDKFIGADYEPVIITNSDGEAVCYYKKDGSSDDTYTTVKPDSIGKYYIQARIPATDGYTAVTAENTFEINFLPAPTVAYTLSGEKDKNGNFADEIYINAPEGYEIAKGFVESYSDSITYTDGLDKIYLRRISDGALTAAIAFNENFMNDTTVTVSAEDVYLGVPVKPVASTNSVGEVTYYYKKLDDMDSAYTTAMPDSVGTYKVQARVAAAGYYTAATAEATFEVKYLPVPEVTYSLFGEEGNNDYYKSDVELVAPDGYKISDKSGDGYKKSIPYSKGLDKIYLKREADGAMTAAITFDKQILIDKTAPVVALQGVNQAGKSVTIKDGLSTFADTLMFAIADDNLFSVTVNDEPVEVNGGKAELLLDSLSNTKTFKIVAEDKAGNTVSLKVTLKAGWLENMIIPVGASLKLEPGLEYFFAEGNSYYVNNDSTEYYGGNPFYVDGTMDCVFTEK